MACGERVGLSGRTLRGHVFLPIFGCVLLESLFHLGLKGQPKGQPAFWGWFPVGCPNKRGHSQLFKADLLTFWFFHVGPFSVMAPKVKLLLLGPLGN